VTWTGTAGDNNWDTGGNWSTGSALTSADAVQINSGTVNLNHAATVSNLTLSGGTLVDSAAMTVSGLFSWTGGTLQGVNGQGSLTAAGGSTISGSLVTLDDGFTFINPAGQTVTWGSAGGNSVIQSPHPATFDNAGTLLLQGNTSMENSSTFNNSGIALQSSGGSSGFFDQDVNNSGT